MNVYTCFEIDCSLSVAVLPMAIAILKARVSDDRGIPEANIDVHVIYDDGESNGNS